MKRTVQLLREGWYGNGDQFETGHPSKKRPVDCQKLWRKCCDIAGTKFVPKTDGITGTIRLLIIDQTYEVEMSYISIDTLVS